MSVVVNAPARSSLTIVPPATAITKAKADFRLLRRSDLIVASFTLFTAAAVALALPCEQHGKSLRAYPIWGCQNLAACMGSLQR